MARPSRIEEKRRELLPAVAAAFADLGYRRATTAELAARCGVGENILYRIWPDKQAMFLAALGFVFEASQRVWAELLADPDGARSTFERLLDHESRHHGEHGLYRIVFAGLSETDDPEIRAGLRALYGRFQAFIERQLVQHRGRERGTVDAALCAWAIVGLGTVSNIGRELELLGPVQRGRLLSEAGRALAGPRVAHARRTKSTPRP